MCDGAILGSGLRQVQAERPSDAAGQRAAGPWNHPRHRPGLAPVRAVPNSFVVEAGGTWAAKVPWLPGKPGHAGSWGRWQAGKLVYTGTVAKVR